MIGFSLMGFLGPPPITLSDSSLRLAYHLLERAHTCGRWNTLHLPPECSYEWFLEVQRQAGTLSKSAQYVLLLATVRIAQQLESAGDGRLLSEGVSTPYLENRPSKAPKCKIARTAAWDTVMWSRPCVARRMPYQVLHRPGNSAAAFIAPPILSGTE